MNKRIFCGFMIVAGVIAGLSLQKTGKNAQPDPRARAEALSRSCSAEFDDPASQEYQQCTEAIQQFEELSRRNPNDVSILLNLGRIYANRSREKSIEAYQRALVRDPGNVTANYELGILLRSPDEQIQHLRAVIAQEPNHREAHGRLAALLAAGSQSEEAVSQIKQQIAIDPDHIDIIANVMQVLKANGHKNEAAEVLAAYLRSGLPSKVKCGDAKSMVKEYPDQLDVRKAFKEQCPGYTLYAEALREKEPHSRVRLLEQAIESGDADSRAHGELALALLQLNAVDRAMAAIKEQIRIDPILGHDQIIAFAAALQARTLVNEEVKVYLAYLASPAPNQLVCAPVRKLLAESGGADGALKQSFQKRCGALVGAE